MPDNLASEYLARLFAFICTRIIVRRQVSLAKYMQRADGVSLANYKTRILFTNGSMPMPRVCLQSFTFVCVLQVQQQKN